MDSRNFRKRLQGSKLNGLWRFLYHWKTLKTYMSEMRSHCSFGHLKHKLWPKERSGVKLSIWLSTTKVRTQLDLLSCRGRATYRWKALDESYNFALDDIAIRSLLAKLWVPKSWESHLAQFRDSHSGVLGEKSHLDVGSVTNHRIYYKGEGGGFRQVRAVVSLVCPCCP
jgi:hypothetical protein